MRERQEGEEERQGVKWRRTEELRKEVDTTSLATGNLSLHTLAKGEEFSHPLSGPPHTIQFTKQPEGADELYVALIVIGRLRHLGESTKVGNWSQFFFYKDQISTLNNSTNVHVYVCVS